jgi:hypothetical protein
LRVIRYLQDHFSTHVAGLADAVGFCHLLKGKPNAYDRLQFSLVRQLTEIREIVAVGSNQEQLGLLGSAEYFRNLLNSAREKERRARQRRDIDAARR